MKIRTILLTLLALASVCGVAAAQTRDQQTRKERLEKEIAILDRQIKDNTRKSESTLTRLMLVQSKMKARQELVKDSDAKIMSLSRQIGAMQREIERTQARLDTMRGYYDRLVKNAYKNRDARIWYMYILASDNLSQGFHRYGFFKNLSAQMNQQAREMKKVQDSLTVEKSKLEALRTQEQKVLAGRQMELKKLKSEERDAKVLSDRLKKQKTKYQKELSSKKSQAAALEREIRKAISGAMGGNSKKPKQPIDYTLAKDFVSNRGKLPWPVQGAVTSSFGKQYHPVFKNLNMPGNNGVNIAVSPNSEVKAVFDGVVAQISVLPGYHQCILHGNYFSLYCKIKNVYVKSGDKIKTGQKIGTVDTIGGETTFHFEIWNANTQPENPQSWLRPLD